ncbi:MAG: glutathione S-transferase family protein [Gammaproteobacteria bacterium]|nr:glutathione S-transferase family protein [Gammaproteobacteria bacterium]MDH3468735.1 glutathione S-transferase family protein [Gammaproteobacteria bacterium]
MDIILHHYPQSPISEKVRVVFGLKKLAWRSVQIPRIPPKPELMPLPGGYRRTPVMHIGADVYCDSQCIIREIEYRYPLPTLLPGGSGGMPWGLARWIDGPFFDAAITVVLGHQAEQLPQDFAADRCRLYFGPNYDLDEIQRTVPHALAQLRAQFGWIEERLQCGRPFLLGSDPGLPDALCYYLTWFVRGRYNEAEPLLNQFPRLLEWYGRVADVGHGSPTDMTASEALDIAAASSPENNAGIDPQDPQGLAAGQRVAVAPDGDGGDPEVIGELATLNNAEIAIRREEPLVGEIIVHFPRVGYTVR